MTERKGQNQRQQKGGDGYYARTDKYDPNQSEGVDTILNRQVWRVQPEKGPKTERPCLWMQAGAVKYKNCNNYYDCNTCKFDKGMQTKVQEGKALSWQDIMRRQEPQSRWCRHTLTGRINNRLCPYNYECSSCEFDQYFEEVLAAKHSLRPQEVQQVKGFDVPMGFYFHNGHTWARIESGGYIRIGLDDFAMRVFGNMDALNLPRFGNVLDKDKQGGEFFKADNKADIRSPLGGIVMEVNTEVMENPVKVNQDPYSEGWLLLLRNEQIKTSMQDLLTDDKALEWFGQEVADLEKMLEEVAGPLAADGGLLAEDVLGNVPELGFDRLKERFL